MENRPSTITNENTIWPLGKHFAHSVVIYSPALSLSLCRLVQRAVEIFSALKYKEKKEKNCRIFPRAINLSMSHQPHCRCPEILSERETTERNSKERNDTEKKVIIFGDDKFLWAIDGFMMETNYAIDSTDYRSVNYVVWANMKIDCV